MWDRRGPNNAPGVNLVAALILNPSITLLSPTSLPTHYNTGTGTFSTLDLTFVSEQFYPISQVTVGKDIGSDHYPHMISVAIKPTIAKFKSRPKLKFESVFGTTGQNSFPQWINTSIMKTLMIHA